MVTYSNAEKKIVESGADAIHKVLAGDDADAKERLLFCLDYYCLLYTSHTVNKAYSVLKQEGFVKLDRRKGAVVSLDIDKIQSMGELRRNLDVVLAWGICKNITRNEVHQVVDEIYDKYTRGCMDTEEDEADEN